MNSIITSGLILALAFSYVHISEKLDTSLKNAQAATVFLQIHEIDIALELYYLEYGTYPTVSNEDVISELFKSHLLKSDKISSEIIYTSKNEGNSYSLVSK